MDIKKENKNIKENNVLKKLNSFDIKINKYSELGKENISKNPLNSQPTRKNKIKIKRHKIRMPLPSKCYFTKNFRLILTNRSIVYKEFFANLKEVEMNPSETDNRIKLENNKETNEENGLNKEEIKDDNNKSTQ